ncbi:MAG TPA: arylsulfatase [Gammaproteobacteria bacterium]|jgi:arylsulfatase|nr:arylsulfatase [Gammaproteobacteria bacterium]
MKLTNVILFLRRQKPRFFLSSAAIAVAITTASYAVTTTTSTDAAPATADSTAKPNIIVIMGDDVGWFNIGAYHQGIMAGKTPNLDKLAAEGMRFTDYYAEPSCTAGRANFITGELPIRTGLTTVGQAGADIGMPAQAPTIATALRALGYTTGQFGKNHLGDLNKYLPCVHGFDEFYGYLYHLDAMEDPYWHSYPPALKDKVGPRNMLHCWATTADDATVQPRWGKIGKQKIEDAGPLPPERMKTVDDEILDNTFKFMDKAKADGKPFFIWLNPSRMHIFTHLSDKYKKTMTPENGWYTEEAGMAQLDDIVGAVMEKLKSMGIDNNTIVVFTTDNGAEVFTWPDGGMTPFAGAKGTALEGGMRVPAIIRWPGKVPAGKVENGIISGLDWFPTLLAAAGNTTIKDDLLKGKQLGGAKYKVHLDGYDQTNLITGKGPSNRHEVLYFTESRLGAVRIDDYKYRFTDQPAGWLGNTVTLDWPLIVNLRLDPFERTSTQAMGYGMDFFAHEFWRFVFVQQEIELLGKTFIDFPPMQPGASFNLEGVKQQITNAIKSRQGN